MLLYVIFSQFNNNNNNNKLASAAAKSLEVKRSEASKRKV